MGAGSQEPFPRRSRQIPPRRIPVLPCFTSPPIHSLIYPVPACIPLPPLGLLLEPRLPTSQQPVGLAKLAISPVGYGTRTRRRSWERGGMRRLMVTEQRKLCWTSGLSCVARMTHTQGGEVVRHRQPAFRLRQQIDGLVDLSMAFSERHDSLAEIEQAIGCKSW